MPHRGKASYPDDWSGGNTRPLASWNGFRSDWILKTTKRNPKTEHTALFVVVPSGVGTMLLRLRGKTDVRNRSFR